MLEQFRLLKTSVAFFRKPGVMRDLLIESKTCEPAPRQMHAQFFDQPTLAADAVQVADQHDPQQKLRIDQWTAGIAIAVLQMLTNKTEVDVFIDQPQ